MTIGKQNNKNLVGFIGQIQSLKVTPYEPEQECAFCGRLCGDSGFCNDACENNFYDERGDNDLGYDEHESPKNLYGE